MVFNKSSLKNKADSEPDLQAFQQILEGHSAVILLIEPQTGVILSANQAAVNFYGYPKPKLCGMLIHEITTLSPEHVALEYQKALKEERNYFVFPHRLASGEERIVEVHSSPVTLQEKQVLFSIVHDITERAQAQEALKQSEVYYHLLADHMTDVIWLRDLNLKLLYVSPSEEKIRGYTLAELQQIPLDQLLTPDSVQLAMELFSVEIPRVLADPTYSPVITREFEFYKRDGDLHSVESKMSVIRDENGNPTAILGQDRDITESKRVKQRLKATQEFQRILLNATSLTTIILLDCAGIILMMNELGAQHFGKNSKEVIGLSIYEVFSKEIADEKKERINEVCRTAAVVQFEDFRGGRWSENSLYPILDTNGKVARIAVYAREITDRKKNEQKLNASEQRYRALAEASHDIIFVVDRDDRISYVNEYASIQFGLPSDAFIGQPRSRWFGPFDTDKTSNSLKQVFETGAPQYVETEMTFSRSTVYLSTWLVALKEQSGVVENVLGISRDISKLKELQNSLSVTNLQLESTVEERTTELRESRDHLRELTQHVFVAQEEERRRISRELHDEAGQALIGLRFSLDSIYKELPTNLRKLRQRMAKSLALIDQTVNRIRTLAYNLRSPALDLLGVNLGIKELCREFSDQTGIEVEYSGVDLEILQDEINISLYRFVQESLTNVAKHANASKVRVNLEYQDETIKASVYDDGQGISVEKANSGIGILGIKERFDNLGGRVEVKPVMPNGTQIQVCLPWNSAAKLVGKIT